MNIFLKLIQKFGLYPGEKVKEEPEERIEVQPCGCVWEAVDILPNYGQTYRVTEWRFKTRCEKHKLTRLGKKADNGSKTGQS